MAEAAASYWQQVGVDVEIIPTDLGVMRPKYFGELPQDESIIGNAGVIGLPTGLNGLNDLNIWWNIKGGNMKLAGNDYARGDDSSGGGHELGATWWRRCRRPSVSCTTIIGTCQSRTLPEAYGPMGMAWHR